MKKYFILVLFFVGVIPTLYSQNYPCTYPYPTCINNHDFDVPATSGQMNFGGPNTVVSDWYVSHGDPEILNFNAPNSPYRSIKMTAYQPSGQQMHNEGIFTCYDFQQGETYQICFWVKNGSFVNLGELRVIATNGLYEAVNTLPFRPTISPPFSEELIDNSYTHNPMPNWTFMSITYTPSQNFNQLWFEPYMANPLVQNQAYSIIIDDIRVNKVSKTSGYNPTISATSNTVNGCNSSTISINNLPPNGQVFWSPATGLNSTSGSSVIATPCETTTYSAIVAGDSICPDCFRDTLQYTINVNTGVTQSDLINNTPNITCGATISLDFIGTPNCPVTYEWKDPIGNTVSTLPNLSLAGATYAHSGTWELHITYPNGCVEILSTQVTVANCCSITADFNFNNTNNPVDFTDITTGSGIIQSWHWDFGDGTTSTVQNPQHSYATPGTYYVCLSVVMSDGTETCCDRICKTVTVSVPPQLCSVKADFTFSGPHGTAQEMYFNSTSTGNGTLCWYYWDFGDGTPTTVNTNPSPRHAYANGNTTYTVCLQVWNCVYDVNGNLISTCDDIICKQVFVPGVANKTGSITSVDENNENKYKVEVYPNPATKEMFVEIEGLANPKVSIVTIQGVKVGDAKKVSDLKYKLDVSGLAAGIYFVNVEGDNRKQVIKFFKE
jgi:PKD repeat protein